MIHEHSRIFYLNDCRDPVRWPPAEFSPDRFYLKWRARKLVSKIPSNQFFEQSAWFEHFKNPKLISVHTISQSWTVITQHVSSSKDQILIFRPTKKSPWVSSHKNFKIQENQLAPIYCFRPDRPDI